MRSSICTGSSCGTLARTSVTTWANRSSGRQVTREPLLARPIGVRPVATMTASGMGGLLLPGRRRTGAPGTGSRYGRTHYGDGGRSGTGPWLTRFDDPPHDLVGSDLG